MGILTDGLEPLKEAQAQLLIAGSRNPDRVRTNAEAGTGALEAATLAEIERILSR